MANRIRIRRTGTVSQIPSTADLLTGELAINYAEGKLFALKDDGTQSIVTIGEDLASESFTNRIRSIVSTSAHNFSEKQNFTNSTQATSTTTGAVIVTGGIGVGGNVVIGGAIDGAVIDCGFY